MITSASLILSIKPMPLGENIVPSGPATVCGMCAIPIAADQPRRPLFSLGKSFTDFASLANGAKAICPSCTAVSNRKLLAMNARGMACSEGLFPFKSNNDIAYWFHHLPEPPFTITVSKAKMQHTHWKVRISTSRALFFIFIENQTYAVRHGKVLEAIEANRAFRAQQLEGVDPKKASKVRVRDLIYSDWKLPFTAFLDSAASPEQTSVIRSLLPGELWLLIRIMNVDSEGLEKPNAI